MIKIAQETQDDLKRAQADLWRLSRDIPKVAVRATNKSMTGTKTDVANIARQNYNFKAGALKKRMSISRASKQNLTGKITSKGRMLHLTDVVGTRQTKRGVTVNVKKETGRQLIPSAFIRRGQYSHKKIVFRRKVQGGEMVGRYPISARMAPFPEDIYNSRENWAKIETAAAQRIDTNVAREVDSEIRKHKGKW